MQSSKICYAQLHTPQFLPGLLFACEVSQITNACTGAWPVVFNKWSINRTGPVIMIVTPMDRDHYAIHHTDSSWYEDLIRRLQDSVISLVGIRPTWRYPNEVVVAFQATFIRELTLKSGNQLFSPNRWKSRQVFAFDRFEYSFDGDVYAFNAPRSPEIAGKYDEGETATAFINPLRPDDIWFDKRCQVGTLIQPTTDRVSRWIQSQATSRVQ